MKTWGVVERLKQICLELVHSAIQDDVQLWHMEVGVLEVNQEHNIPFLDQPQHRQDCLHLEAGEGDIFVAA